VFGLLFQSRTVAADTQRDMAAARKRMENADARIARPHQDRNARRGSEEKTSA
jgi:hypothetical protein